MSSVTPIAPIGPIKKDGEDQESTQQMGSQNATIAPSSAASGVGNAAPGQPNQPPSSGRFTNINKYMQSNQQAGQNLGQAVGNKVQQSVDRTEGAATGAQGALGKQIGTTNTGIGQIQTHTQKLGEKAEPVKNDNGLLSQVNTTGNAYDASGYTANTGNRGEYAKSITQDQSKLNEFLDYASGGYSTKQKDLLSKQQEAAQLKTDAALKEYQNRNKQLQTEANRNQLLGETVKANNYNLGKQRLDQTFLQTDKSNTLGNLRKNIQQQNQQFNTQNQLPTLLTDAEKARTGLDTSTEALGKQTQANLADLTTDLESRKEAINAARKARLEGLQTNYQALANNGEIDQNFANLMGLTGDEQVFNAMNNMAINAENGYLNTQKLEQMANSLSDVANQGDVDLFSTFAKLAQTNPAVISASKLGDAEANKEALRQKIQQDASNYNAYLDANTKLYKTNQPGNTRGATEVWGNARTMEENMMRLSPKEAQVYADYAKGMGVNTKNFANPFSNSSFNEHEQVKNALTGGNTRAHGTDLSDLALGLYQNNPGLSQQVRNQHSAAARNSQINNLTAGMYNDVLKNVSNLGGFNRATIKK